MAAFAKKRGLHPYSLLIFWAILLLIGLTGKLLMALKIVLNSDHVQPALYFYDILESGNFCLRNWHIVGNPLLFTDIPIYFILAFFFGMNLFSLKIGAFLVFLINVFLFWLLLERVYRSLLSIRAIAILSLSVALFGSYFFIQPQVHMGAINFCFMAFLIVIGMIRKESFPIEAKGRFPTSLFGYPLLFVLSVIAVFSDPYFILIFTIPVICSMIFLKLTTVEFLNYRKIVVLSLISLSSALIGLGLQKAAILIDLKIIMVGSKLATFQRFQQNLQLYMQIILSLFDLNLFQIGQPPLNFIVRAINFIIFIAIVLNIPRVWKQEADPIKRFLQTFFLFILIILSSAFLLSTQPYDISHARYLKPVLYLYALFLAILIGPGGGFLKLPCRAILIILLLVSSTYNIYDIIRFKQDQPHLALARFLEKEKLYYGYSSYWHSNIVTFLSNNRVRVRAVAFENEEVSPFLFASKSDWYVPEFHQGQTFMMVSHNKNLSQFGLSELNADRVREIFGAPSRVLTFEDMDIYVWPFNIMNHEIKEQDLQYPKNIEINEKIPHTVGHLESYSRGNVIYSLKGESGFLVFGPYWPLKEGKYEVTFNLFVKGPRNAQCAIIDVCITDKIRDIVAIPLIKKEVDGSPKDQWENHVVEFTAGVNEKRNLLYEFRVFTTGLGEVKVRAISLRRK